MDRHDLADLDILVVEDEYMLAMELSAFLTEAGARVLGPVGTVEGALALVASASKIDGAILDANLQGELVFPVAEKLQDNVVPFLFTTGYDASIIPSRFEEVVRIGKPTSLLKLGQEVALMITPASDTPDQS